MTYKYDTLKDVNEALSITGNFQDASLKQFISFVRTYLKNGGVHEQILDSEIASGTITRGVDDLRSTGQLSQTFEKMASQLAMIKPKEQVVE